MAAETLDNLLKVQSFILEKLLARKRMGNRWPATPFGQWRLGTNAWRIGMQFDASNTSTTDRIETMLEEISKP